MLKNNIILVIFHFVFSLFYILILHRDYTNEIYKNLIMAVIVGIVYFMFGFLSIKWFKYYDSKAKNLLSFSSILFISIFLFIISYNTMEPAWLMLYGLFNGPFIYIGITFGLLLETIITQSSEYRSVSLILNSAISIPYILSIWLGLETRKKWDNWKNKKSEEIVK